MDTSKAEIKEILATNSHLELINNGDRVKCQITGHEMPCRLDSLQSYISGKRYKRLTEKLQTDCGWKKHEQHLVPSSKRGREHQLFCKLTLRHLNKQPHHVQKHLSGRRFQKALRRWETCQLTGEVYKPLASRPRHQPADMEEEEDGDGRDSLEDDLSDLYPPAHFASSSEDEDEEGKGEDTVNRTGSAAAQSGSDFDCDAMEMDDAEETTSTKLNVSKSKKQKRKGQTNADISMKKRKTQDSSHHVKKRGKSQK